LQFSAGRASAGFFQHHFRSILFVLLGLSLGLSIVSKYWGGEIEKHIFPLSLGLLGSTIYIFFNLMNVVSEKAIDETDVFSSYARLMLGPAFGWLFFQIYQSGTGTSSATQTQLFSVLIPFAAGFSTRLVLGIINQSIQAIEIALGLGDKRSELKSRGSRK